jgi:hypothetical protein
MGISILDISRQDAIAAAGLACLPDKLSSTATVVWLRAIGLVRKINGTKNYVLLESDGERTKIKRDFGSVAQIAEIEEIYPYESLEKKYVPSFQTDEDMLSYILKMNGNNVREKALLDRSDKSYEQYLENRRTVYRTALSCAVRQAQSLLADELKYKKLAEKKNENSNGTEQKKTITLPYPKSKRGRKSSAGKQQGQ